MLITAVCHSTSQLEQRWGKHGAATVWASLRDQGPARRRSRDPDTLEHTSKLCGTVRRGDGKEPVVPPELLRMLPSWRALVIRMNLSPVVVKVRPAWRRLAYRLGRHPLPVPRPVPALAPMLRLADLPPRTPPPHAAPELAASANGHGGKPGSLTEADR